METVKTYYTNLKSVEGKIKNLREQLKDYLKVAPTTAKLDMVNGLINDLNADAVTIFKASVRDGIQPDLLTAKTTHTEHKNKMLAYEALQTEVETLD